MTPYLKWREATRGDRPLLQAFSCTTPAPKGPAGRPLPHPKPWQRKIEAGIRGLKPPVGDGVLLLGEDSTGLAAVVNIWFAEAGAVAKLAVVAVASRRQRSDLRLADEALEMGLRAASDYGFGAGHHSVIAYGLIDCRNHASKAMCHRAGLRPVDVHDDG